MDKILRSKTYRKYTLAMHLRTHIISGRPTHVVSIYEKKDENKYDKRIYEKQFSNKNAAQTHYLMLRHKISKGLRKCALEEDDDISE